MFILEQRDAFQRRLGGRRLEGETLAVSQHGRQSLASFVQQSETLLQGQDSTHAEVNARLSNRTFLHKFFQQHWEFPILRHHAHVDARKNRHANGVLVCGRHLVP